jgi:hypothetical protein
MFILNVFSSIKILTMIFMKLSKKAKAGLVGLAAGEIINGAWNVSYQGVVNEGYNAGYLARGQIESRSSLFPWPTNGVTYGPFHGNVPRDLSWPESAVYNVLGNPVARGAIIVAPIAYAGYRLHRMSGDAERVGRANEAADGFSKTHFNDFQGKDSEEKRADAFLAARSFLDRNRKRVRSTEDASALLEKEYRNGSIGTYEFEDGESKISSALGKIRSNMRGISKYRVPK